MLIGLTDEFFTNASSAAPGMAASFGLEPVRWLATVSSTHIHGEQMKCPDDFRDSQMVPP